MDVYVCNLTLQGTHPYTPNRYGVGGLERCQSQMQGGWVRKTFYIFLKQIFEIYVWCVWSANTKINQKFLKNRDKFYGSSDPYILTLIGNIQLHKI